MKVNVKVGGFYVANKDGKSAELELGEQDVSEQVGKLLLKTKKGVAVEAKTELSEADKKLKALMKKSKDDLLTILITAEVEHDQNATKEVLASIIMEK